MARGLLRVMAVVLVLCSILSVQITQAAEDPLPQSPSQPQVDGLVDFISPQPADAGLVEEAIGAVVPAYNVYRINRWLTKKITGKTPVEHLAGVAKNTLKSLVEEVVYWSAYWLATLGNYLLHKVAWIVGLLLGARKFMTNPLVERGWPFVQGVANLGFILALIFIAITVVLRLDNFNVKKLIPRLLLAALLVNFSLLIGVILIDLSRVLMAIMVKALGNTSVEDIAVDILFTSKIFNQALQFKRVLSDPGAGFNIVTDSTLKMVIAAVFIWGLLGAFFTLMVGLFMRYIMLILLLIVSPLAYLALAFPGMGSLATRWWKEFIKYVFYGPIVLFVLVLLVGITNRGAKFIIPDLFGAAPGAPAVQDTLNSIISVTIVIVMLIAAATVGKQMGIAGSAAAVGFASKWGKRAAYYGSGAGLAVAGGRGVRRGAAYAGQVAKSAATRELKYTGKRVMDRTGISAIGDFFGERRRVIDRDRQRREEERRRTSGGTLAAQRQYAPEQYARTVASQTRVNNVTAAGAGAAWNNPALLAENLRDRNVRNVVSAPQMRTMVTEAQTGRGNNNQIEILVNSPEMVGRMDDAMVNDLMDALTTRLATAAAIDPRTGRQVDPAEAQQMGRMIGDFNRSLRTLNDQQNRPNP